jgi:xylulokinase
MSTMGVDVGTTGCKAGVFDAEGNLRALAYREYPLVNPEPGWAEIDSAEVARLCLDAIREAAVAWRQDPVRALGISCQGEAFTPIDGSGNVLGNAMVSSDARAAKLVGPWSDQFGRNRLYQITGHTPHPMFTLFKLIWLRENRPEIWKAARRFLCFEELIQSHL